VIACRRYRCTTRSAVVLVVPRGIEPRRHYGRAAICFALALWSLAGWSQRAVRHQVGTWPNPTATSWRTSLLMVTDDHDRGARAMVRGLRATLYPIEPAPAASERPARFPSPFAPGPPHPLARRAAEALIAELERGAVPGEAALHAAGAGKMFGVLVVEEPGGRVSALRGFSGMLDGRWHVDGFVPPLFDVAARDAIWPAGEAALAALDRAIDDVTDGAGARADREALAAIVARHERERTEMIERHRARREARLAARAALVDGDRDARHALDQESRADTAERRRLDAAHAAELAAPQAAVAALDARRDALAAERAARSRGLWDELLAGYVVPSVRGARRTLVELFAPIAPPGGAGDCAAPKLLAYALADGLRPLALAELWWGAPPVTGGRHHRAYYPACRGKCGPILPHLLDGLDADVAPVFGAAPIADDEPRPIFEDDHVLVVAKPCGLLSVPGRSGLLRDSVQTRLRARYPAATGPLVVHRLDLDTSGLLVCAKDLATHAALQRQFARRELHKRYVAWVAGDVAATRGARGTIELALRPDLDDRPRQLVDSEHGKPALTDWEVVARADGPRGPRTRVAFTPRTGRTHQLRLHAAHSLGLGTPIVGDRLYGTDAADESRLLLHAEAIGFTHPHTGAKVELTLPAPF
jgi:tRNA pseudouridine32 synthase/23S rRNA pseudouridine746 synthase